MVHLALCACTRSQGKAFSGKLLSITMHYSNTASQHHQASQHAAEAIYEEFTALSLKRRHTEDKRVCLGNWNMFSAEKQKQVANESGPQSKVQQQLLRSIKDKSTSIHQDCPTQHELIKLPCLLSSRADFDQIKSQNFQWSTSSWERWRKEENSATSSNWNWNKLL